MLLKQIYRLIYGMYTEVLAVEKYSYFKVFSIALKRSRN